MHPYSWQTSHRADGGRVRLVSTPKSPTLWILVYSRILQVGTCLIKQTEEGLASYQRPHTQKKIGSSATVAAILIGFPTSPSALSSKVRITSIRASCLTSQPPRRAPRTRTLGCSFFAAAVHGFIADRCTYWTNIAKFDLMGSISLIVCHVSHVIRGSRGRYLGHLCVPPVLRIRTRYATPYPT